jgi:hypothetical protein
MPLALRQRGQPSAPLIVCPIKASPNMAEQTLCLVSALSLIRLDINKVNDRHITQALKQYRNFYLNELPSGLNIEYFGRYLSSKVPLIYRFVLHTRSIHKALVLHLTQLINQDDLKIIQTLTTESAVDATLNKEKIIAFKLTRKVQARHQEYFYKFALAQHEDFSIKFNLQNMQTKLLPVPTQKPGHGRRNAIPTMACIGSSPGLAKQNKPAEASWQQWDFTALPLETRTIWKELAKVGIRPEKLEGYRAGFTLALDPSHAWNNFLKKLSRKESPDIHHIDQIMTDLNTIFTTCIPEAFG